MTKIAAFSLLSLGLCACQTTAPAVHTTVTGCQAFGIIRPSSKDTEETKRQVLAHDLAYQNLCGTSK